MNLHKQLALMLANLRKKRPYYCELEYLQSSGTQNIDTLWAPSSNNLRVKFKVKSMGSPNGKAICGSEKSGVVPRWVFIMYGQNADATKIFPLTGDWNNNNKGFTFTSGKVLEIDWETSATSTTITDSVSGISYTQDFTNTINYPNNTETLKLFQNSSTQKSSIQMNYYQIWDNGVLVRDLIPVLDWDFVPCMYDRITGQFFYNAGTGTFSYGREIHYVDYLESTGTQYINTGVYLTNNHSVEIDYQLTATGQSRTGLFGNLNTARYGSLFSPSNKLLEHGYGAGNDYWQQGAQDTNRHVFKQEKNKIYVDGALVYTFSQATFNVGVSAPLGNFGYTNYTPAKAKYYSSQWSDGDTLVRDYLPSIDENGVGFMFDKIERKIYDNAGTGSFVVPSYQVDGNGRIIEPEYEQ